MNTIETTLAPMQVSKPVVKAACQYLIVNFLPEEWGTARINFLDEDNRIVVAHDVPITEAESQGWQGDDQYVLTLALQKCLAEAGRKPVVVQLNKTTE